MMPWDLINERWRGEREEEKSYVEDAMTSERGFCEERRSSRLLWAEYRGEDGCIVEAERKMVAGIEGEGDRFWRGAGIGSKGENGCPFREGGEGSFLGLDETVAVFKRETEGAYFHPDSFKLERMIEVENSFFFFPDF